MYGWVDGWVNGWWVGVDGWSVVGWVDERMDRCIDKKMYE